MQTRVPPEPDTLADYRERSDGAVFSDHRAGSDPGVGMNARTRARRLIKQPHGARKVEVRILRDQAGDIGARNSFGHEDGAGPRVLYFGSVFRICQECKLTRTGMLHAGHTGNLQFAVALQATPQTAGD